MTGDYSSIYADGARLFLAGCAATLLHAAKNPRKPYFR